MHAAGDIAALADDDARKLLVVLRKSAGAPLEIVDSSGRTFAAHLVVDGTSARAELERELVPRRADILRLTLAQGIPKGQKMDFVVEKATELGVAAIVPFASERTQGADRGREGKVERWRRLAKAAAQQCGRTDVPTVEQPVGFADLLASIGRYDAALIPWELEGGSPLRERLPALLEGVRDVLVIIGPRRWPRGCGGRGGARTRSACGLARQPDLSHGNRRSRDLQRTSLRVGRPLTSRAQHIAHR